MRTANDLAICSLWHFVGHSVTVAHAICFASHCVRSWRKLGLLPQSLIYKAHECPCTTQDLHRPAPINHKNHWKAQSQNARRALETSQMPIWSLWNRCSDCSEALGCFSRFLLASSDCAERLLMFFRCWLRALFFCLKSCPATLVQGGNWKERTAFAAAARLWHDVHVTQHVTRRHDMWHMWSW